MALLATTRHRPVALLVGAGLAAIAVLGVGPVPTHDVLDRPPAVDSKPAAPEPAGLVDSSSGARLHDIGSPPDGDVILVTAEPEGGSPQPTSDPVLAAQMT